MNYINNMISFIIFCFFVSANMMPCRCEYRRILEYWSSKIIQNKTREELIMELEPKLQNDEKGNGNE